ncbi:MAG TPA: EAL domain-containing protein, partial [Xanthomonadaceae bacterium]|nr:EAL domain-containing protein [Xanthomonadaceae bacterium]
KNWSQVVLGAIGDGVISLDATGIVDYINPAAERITGWARDAATGSHVAQVLPLIGVREPPMDSDAAALSAWFHSSTEANTTLRMRDGVEREVQLAVSVVMDGQGGPKGLVLTFRDISQTATLMRELAHRASHDPLTGVFNREEFERRLKRLLGDAQSGGGPHAVCFIDLDQFKLVNETCGHAAGDALLKEIAGMLHVLVGDDDVLARLGDDAFGLLLPQMTANRAMQVAQQAVGAIERMRFGWGDRHFAVSGSAGVASIAADAHGIDDVLVAAEAACQVAKEGGRNRVHLFEPSDVDVAHRHGEMRWVPRLEAALEVGDFQLMFQDIVPTATGSASGRHLEVLICLPDAAGRLVSPGEFLPAARRYGLMGRIDRWVTAQVGEWLHWRAGTGHSLPELVTINLSGSSLGDPQFRDFAEEQARALPAGATFCFEITAGEAIANLTEASEFIGRMKRHGCQFALDDFGCGLASFAYLKRLPVDYIKIDGEFVKEAATDPVNLAMVEAIHRIGKVMGLKTIAERVESEAVFERIRAIGVDYCQGYHFGGLRPLLSLA